MKDPQNPGPAPNPASSKDANPTETGGNGSWSLDDLEQAEAIRSWNAQLPAVSLDDIPRA